VYTRFPAMGPGLEKLGDVRMPQARHDLRLVFESAQDGRGFDSRSRLWLRIKDACPFECR
jgi:hypothetical protein